MDTKKIRAIGALALVLIWACLTFCLWFLPAKATSEASATKATTTTATNDNCWLMYRLTLKVSVATI